MAGFHEIIGHDDVVNHLQNAIQMGKVSHAYIFNGEVGAGKKMLASAFAMALQCEKHGTDPCMECDSCKRALSKNHPDIITITHEKPNSIGIEDIRIQLIDDVSIKPYTGPYKIYILNEAEKQNIYDYLDLFTMWFRDVLLFKATKEVDGLIFKDQYNYIKERAKKSSYEGIENIIDAIGKARERLHSNVNFDLVMELLFMTIREN